jgi:capsular exopolysaccharide synthesis family protein
MLPHLALPSLQERALYTSRHLRSEPAEAARKVRALLMATAVDPQSTCLLVTSCEADEGKTHASVHLAVAFAQLGSRVLLIDADGRCPTMHDVFGAVLTPGLRGALAQPRFEPGFAIPTEVPNLFLLPHGQAPEDPETYLSSPAFRVFLKRVRETMDVVIIDSPPASLVSDAYTLAPLVDAVVLVVRPGRASRTVAWSTLGKLRLAGGRVAGILVNDVPPPRKRSKYFDERPRTPRFKPS